MNSPRPPTESPPAADETTVLTSSARTASPGKRAEAPHTSDVLGVAWLHGSLSAVTFRRQQVTSSWESPVPVRTLGEFTGALDTLLEVLSFTGTELFLVLEHGQFNHQTEHAPAFSESATRAYLRSRVERYEKEHEPVLWSRQRTRSLKKECAFILHLLPAQLYDALHEILRTRRLELTRIVPLSVPLQQELLAADVPPEQPVLIACQTGGATAVIVGRADGEILFARTLLTTWHQEPVRTGVEINRSLLYAKQQFGVIIDQIRLLGKAPEQVSAEIHSRCGVGKTVLIQARTATDWLQRVNRISPRDPLNLLAVYRRGKYREQWIRRIVISTCWLGLTFLSVGTWSQARSHEAERQRLSALAADQTARIAERDRLIERNRATADEEKLVTRTIEQRLPPVAPKVLAYVTSLVPIEMRLTEFNLRWDQESGAWTLHLEGVVTGDEEFARGLVARLESELNHGPLRVRINSAGRGMVMQPVTSSDASNVQRFTLEGGLFEG